jgi:hypothetical protein
VSALTQIAQDDFAAGMIRGVAPDTQPGVGVYSALNGLFNDDGDIYRRGGSRYYSQTAGAALTWMWSGRLGSRDLILIATETAVYQLSGDVVVLADSQGLLRPVRSAVVGDVLYLPNGRAISVSSGEPLGVAWVPPGNIPGGTMHLETIAGRLVVASGDVVAFSEPITPGVAPVFVADDFHRIPGGVTVTGVIAVQDTLMVFTDYGLWTISNMAYNLTDAAGNIQQTLSLSTPELSLTHEAGLAVWNGRVVAPCVDRVYLLDAFNAPQPISDSITSLWMEYVRAGALPGTAKVYRSTLFLPVIARNPDTLAYDVVTTLTCRLHRPVQGRYLYFPWAELSGHAARMRAFDVSLRGAYSVGPQTESAPFLLGAGEDGRVADLSGMFTPRAETALDADGSAIALEVESRDFPTGRASRTTSSGSDCATRSRAPRRSRSNTPTIAPAPTGRRSAPRGCPNRARTR